MTAPARPWIVGAAIAIAATLAGAGCGSKHAAPAATLQPARQKLSPSGSLTVFAAASLTEAFDDEKAALSRTDPGLRLTYAFAGSQALAQQIVQGARADVFASADQSSMQTLVLAGLVGTPRVFARNRLEIAVAPGNPKHVAGLRDLARAGLVVVLVDPSVPAGNYSRQALSKAGVSVNPRSLELDVKSALAKVASGEADAAIVYVSDVLAAGSRASGVPIADDENVVATYPIAVLKATANRAGAEAFVDQVVSGSGRQAILAHGFLPAS